MVLANGNSLPFTAFTLALPIILYQTELPTELVNGNLISNYRNLGVKRIVVVTFLRVIFEIHD